MLVLNPEIIGAGTLQRRDIFFWGRPTASKKNLYCHDACLEADRELLSKATNY
jgi:hypothetical protein